MSVFASIRSRIAQLFNSGPRYVSPTNGGMSGMLSLAGGRWAGSLEAMGSVGTLYSIIRLLSTSTAQVDWHLYRKQVDGRRVYGPAEDNRIEVTKHLALKVLDQPNEYMTRMELIERTQMYLDLVGEAFWLVEKVGSMPIGLWPLSPDKMDEVVSDTGLIGWTYREPDGTRIPFKLDEIIHIKLPSPTNMYRGMGPVQALRVDLESVNAAGMYNRNYFRNSAAPSGVIQAPHEMTDREFDRVAMQWGERHQGARNAHRVGVLDNGLTWQDTTTSLRDMQFVELRNMSRELIREAYGIHQHMLGLSDDVNRANAVAASIDFARWQLVPRLERIKQALNYRFLPMFGETGVGVEFCYDDPIPPDAETENAERDSKIGAVVALVNAGADPASACEVVGLPEIEWTEQQVMPAVAPVSPPPAPQTTQDDPQITGSDAAAAARLIRGVFA